MDSFYATGIAHPSLLTIGSAYKGFNDNLASWGSNRVMNQQCGQTWLATWAEVNKYYSASNQLPILQLPTWNDYEEGTEIESGIDNCVTVSAALPGSTLNWSITGQESTHRSLRDPRLARRPEPDAVGRGPRRAITRWISADTFSPTGTYRIYVKAIGKPGLLNQMSAAVTFTR